jgi:hypothetical protein
MNMKNTHPSDPIPNREVILEEETGHRHTLVGDLLTAEKYKYMDITIYQTSHLVHEHPDGSKGEHHTLPISKGEWSMGTVVKYHPLGRYFQKDRD